MKKMEEAFGKVNTAEMSVRNREEGNQIIKQNKMVYRKY